MKSKIINIFGGPGVGKSTQAAHLFSIMKKNNMSVELTQEFPKIIAWENNKSAIIDQFYIAANQHRNITRLYGNVEYIIVDSPIILSNIYCDKYQNHNEYPTSLYIGSLDIFIIELFKKYDNINVFLKRQNQTFNESGRFQNLNESKFIDLQIKKTLLDNNIHHVEFDVDVNTSENIYKHIKTLNYDIH